LLKLLPDGYVETLKMESGNKIGRGVFLVWVPDRKRFLVNTSSGGKVLISRPQSDREETIQVRRPTEIFPGDLITLDFCQYLFFEEDIPKPVELNEDEISQKSPIEGLRTVRKIGQGASSEVFLMTGAGGRKVAVKFLLSHLLHDQSANIRFEREGKVARSLDHPRILKVFEVGKTEQTGPYLVSEYLGEGSLRDILDKELYPSPAEAGRLIAEIADGLSYLHSLNLVHRDVKPSNIFMKAGSPIVADFGIVRGVDLTTATETGFTAGTPHYMSPEQFRGFTEPRSDQYALGIVFYEMVTGSKVFQAEDPIALAYMHVHQVPELSNANGKLPGECLQVVQRMISKQPGDRFDTVLEAARRLRQSLV
jgi:serine/threonine protein kinase